MLLLLLLLSFEFEFEVDLDPLLLDCLLCLDVLLGGDDGDGDGNDDDSSEFVGDNDDDG